MIKKYLVIVASVFAVSAGFLGVYVWYWEVRPHVLEVYPIVIDTVISTFIRTPDNHTILIDGGKTGAVMRMLTSHMPFYRRNIDTVILTKNDDAHAAGLVDVLNRYHVGQFIEMADVFGGPDASARLKKIASTSTAYVELMKIVAQKKVRDKKVGAGDQVNFEEGEYGAVSATVLFPPNSSAFKFSKTNLPQLAMRIQYGSTSFVAADLSKTEQKYVAELAASSSGVAANVLIAQHVGGATAASEPFFDAIHPDYIVISKKPTVPRATTSTAKKPKKPPFSIFNLSVAKIVNLATDGKVTFISDGKTVSKK